MTSSTAPDTMAVPSSKRLLRRLFGALTYLAYLVAIVLLFFYVVFWRPWVNTLQEKEVPESPTLPTIRHVPMATMEKVGNLSPEKASSFIHFEFSKPAGTIRVCAIGDSFVLGAETGPTQDYPGQLGKLFRERGYPNVEVLNFGNNWHGFHQAAILWQDIARPMGCDIILTGPASFFTDRDTQMNHTRDMVPYFLHSIFVPDTQGEGLRRIDVPGAGYEDRFGYYYRFIPHWDQLRYENNPPPLWRALLPAGQTVVNPFLPFDPAVSVSITWQRLFREIAQGSRQMFILTEHQDIAAMGSQVQLPNLQTAYRTHFNHFPNRAVAKHASGTGNAQAAQLLFNLLTQQPDLNYPAVRVEDIAHPDSTPALGLDRLQSLAIVTDTQPLGHFIYIDHRMHQRLALPADPGLQLLNLRAPSSSLLDGLFLLLAPQVDPDQALVLQDNQNHRIPLGTPQWRSQALSMREHTIPGLILDYSDNLWMDLDEVERATGIHLDGQVSLLLGDQVLLQGQTAPHMRTIPLQAQGQAGLLRAVSDQDSQLDWQRAPETVYLEATHSQGAHRIPVGQSVRVMREAPPLQGQVATVICRTAAGAALAKASNCPPSP